MSPSKSPGLARLKTRRDSLRETLARAATLAHEAGPRLVYARFLLDGLPDHARQHFWQAAKMLLADGGQGFIEFRTESDRWAQKLFTNE